MNLSGVFEKLTAEELELIGNVSGREVNLIPFIDLDDVVHDLQNYLEKVRKGPTIAIARARHIEVELICVILRKVERHKLRAS